MSEHADDPGRRYFTAAYRALNGNVIPLGEETVIRADADNVAEMFRTEDPEGPHYFVASRVVPPWMPGDPEGDES